MLALPPGKKRLDGQTFWNRESTCGSDPVAGTQDREAGAPIPGLTRRSMDRATRPLSSAVLAIFLRPARSEQTGSQHPVTGSSSVFHPHALCSLWGPWWSGTPRLRETGTHESHPQGCLTHSLPSGPVNQGRSQEHSGHDGMAARAFRDSSARPSQSSAAAGPGWARHTLRGMGAGRGAPGSCGQGQASGEGSSAACTH